MGSLEGAVMVEKQWWYRDTAVVSRKVLCCWPNGRGQSRFLSTANPVRSSPEDPWKAMQQTAPFQSAFRAAAAAAERKIRESQVVVPDRTERKAAAPINRECRCKIESVTETRPIARPPAAEEDESEMEMSMQARIAALRQERRARTRGRQTRRVCSGSHHCSE
jgi:hypothetical protein